MIGKKGGDEAAARALGFPAFATKNTTRVGGADPTADAAGRRAGRLFGDLGHDTTARGHARGPRRLAGRNRRLGADEPAGARADPALGRREPALGERRDAGRAATRPARSRPTARRSSASGDVAKPKGYKTTSAGGSNPYALAAADRPPAGRGRRAQRRPRGHRARRAGPSSPCRPRRGRPSPATRCSTRKRDELPKETLAALRGHQQPKIYVLGPPDVISDKVLSQLRRLGTVTRIGGKDPVANSIAFARFVDGRFGWGVVDPGHGLVFVERRAPARRRRRGAALGHRHVRPAAARPGRRACPPRWFSTCSTSSPATSATRSAASTTTAGSSATSRRSRSKTRRG